MNKLKPEKQAMVLSALVEGNSIRSTERMTGVHRDTIMRLTGRVGSACRQLLDETMRDLTSTDIQVDEIWCYVGKKQRHVKPGDRSWYVGDFWTWVAIDSDSKIVPTYMIGKRDSIHAEAFLGDLAPRLRNRVQLSSDGLRLYAEAVARTFGPDVDYGQIVKTYEAEPLGPGRYSPPKVTSVDRRRVSGDPDMEKISTSYVERNNLSMRMGMRRFTRLTNGFSKRLGGLEAAVALHFGHYNFVREHKTLGTTPAVAAGVADHVWTIREIVELLDRSPATPSETEEVVA